VKQFEKTTLRIVLVITLSLIKMFGLKDMFSINILKKKFKKKKKYIVLPLRRNKVDTAMEGMLALVWVVKENSFNLVKLIKIYLKKTQSRRVIFLEKREEILGEIKTRSKKHEVRR
jgi:hypothetical protein